MTSLRAVTLLGTTVWLALVLMSAPTPVQAVEDPDGRLGIRLVNQGTDAADDPRAARYVVDHVEPGNEIRRTVAVSNTTRGELEIPIYVGAARIEDGSWITPPDRSGELSEWTTFSRNQLHLAAGTSEQVELTIDVPPDASPGERYGVVWVEAPAVGDEVKVINRVGVRVYLSVGGTPEPRSDFAIGSLTASRSDDGVPVVEAQVENTGERALDLNGELTLDQGPGGLRAGPFPSSGQITIGPGQTAPMTVELDPEIPTGPWLARMVARSGTVEKAVEATIVFPGSAGESSDPVDAEEVPLHRDRGVLIPVAIGLIILMLMLLGLFWFFWRRRRDEDDQEDEEETGDRALSKASSRTG